MPIDVQMPDGTIISGVPDNITQADLLKRYKAFAPPADPSGAVPDELGRYDAAKQDSPPSAGFSAKDTALALGTGIVGAGKSVADAFGADNAVSQALGDVNKGLSEQYSPERKAEMARREQLQKQASKGTIGDEISTFLGGVAEAPVQSLAQGLGSIVPYVGTGIIGGVAKLGGATVKAINTVLGATQGAGAVKGSLYDGVKQELEKSGMSPKEAAEKASKAQEYLGENFLDIAGGAALGGVGARVGVENMLTPGAAAKLDKNLVSRMGKAALAEAPLEGAQGGQEQLAINRALQKQGVDVGTFEGVAGAAARDAAVGALTGSAVGVRGPKSEKVAEPPPTPPTPPGSTPPPLAAPPGGSQDTQAMIDELQGKPPAPPANAAPEQTEEERNQAIAINNGNVATGYVKNILDRALQGFARAGQEYEQTGKSPSMPKVIDFLKGQLVPLMGPEKAAKYIQYLTEEGGLTSIENASNNEYFGEAVNGVNNVVKPISIGTKPPAEPKAQTPSEPLGNVWESIQNRDRSTPASVAQMAKIANEPDYNRVSMSRDYGTGAPIVAGSELEPTRLGRTDVVTGADGKKVPIQYGVIEAGDVIASHNSDGTKNASYADQSVPAFRAITNGRVAGLQAAYRQGTAGDYKSSLMGDDLHGIDPKVIEGMQNPMLVRVMPMDQVNKNTGDISNTGAGLSFNIVEQAKNDVNRLDLSTVQFGENGEVSQQTIKDFIKAMPTTEQGNLMDKQGNPTKQAVERVDAAIFQQAYGNDKLTELAFQAQDEEARNIVRALNMAAAKAIRLGESGDYDVRPLVNEAVELAINARRNNISLSDAAKQVDMTANPLANDIIQMFADNPRSAKAIGENLSNLFDNAYNEGSKEGSDMFGEVPKRPVDQLIKESFAKKVEPDLFAEPEKAAAKPTTKPVKKPVSKPAPAVSEEPKQFKSKKTMVQIAKDIDGIEKGSDLAQYLVDEAPNAATKAIADRILFNIKAIEDSGVPVKIEVLKGADRKRWYGSSLPVSAHRKISYFKVEYNGLNAKGEPETIPGSKDDMAGMKVSRTPTGTRYSTLMHELLHVISQVQLDALAKRNFKGPEKIIHKELRSIYNAVRDQIVEDRKNLPRDQWHPLIDQVGTYYNHSILKDVHELFVRALTEKDVQSYLSGIKMGKKSALTKLMELFRKAIGLDPAYQSALDRIMIVSDKIFAQTPADMKRLAQTEGYDFPAIKDEPTVKTESPQFKKWFGDSKAVDENGNPLIVYHGTQSFDGYEFKPSEKINRSNNIDGYYFTTNEKEAIGYSTGGKEQAGPKAKVIPAYLSIKKPFVKGSKVTPAMLEAYKKEIIKDNPQLGERAEEYANGKAEVMKERGESGRSYAPGIFPNISFPTDAMQRVLKAGGYDGFKDGDSHWIAFDSTQIKSATENTGEFNAEIPDIRYEEVTDESSKEKPPAEARNYLGQPVKPTWEFPEDTFIHVPGVTDVSVNDLIYKFQDKQIDTKRAQAAIAKAAGQITDEVNAYEKEQLFHGKVATSIREYLLNELLPAVKQLKALNLKPQEMQDYLLARHAKERNDKMNELNKLDPRTGKERTTPWELQDRASGMSTDKAKELLDNLDPAKKASLEKVAKMFDEMVTGTQKILVDSGADSQDTIDAWNDTYKHYVPLFRIEEDFNNGGMGSNGLSKGFNVSGNFSKRAMGSSKEVQDIIGNLIKQRERALIRAEKLTVTKALYGLFLMNPNPDVALPVNPDAIKSKEALIAELEGLGYDDPAGIANNLMEEPKTRYISKGKQVIDKNTGLPTSDTEEAVRLKTDNLARFGDNVLTLRIDGKNRYIFFNQNNPDAKRMATSLKSLDVESLGTLTSLVSKATRWFASVNTQYNPIFAAVNLIRDVGGAQFNLTTTPLAGKQAQVTAGIFPAMRGIFNVLRDERKGKVGGDGAMEKAFREFRKEGGQTGYRDSLDRKASEKSIVDEQLAKITAGVNAKKAFKAVFGLLSDFNDTLENAIRLSAYMTAIKPKDSGGAGLSKQQAAILAKNLTVNFDKKGQLSANINALYAFFNASIQGTARLAQTLKGPKGKAIIGGGILLGSMQSVLLAMAGFKDDEPPEFVKERNFIIPTPDGNYLSIPYPLGLHILPSLGRITTEFVLTGGKNPTKKVGNLIGVFADGLSPVGSAGPLQTIAPTVLDPLAALSENKDAFGRPIYKKDQATNPTPGYMRSRESSSEMSKGVSYFLNLASGGSKYSKGLVSPTADEIDYVVGQVTGGVGRELMKTGQTIKSASTGEDLPAYRVPLLGRFYGETESNAAEASRFYNNVIKMADHENEIKGRIKNKEPVAPYLKDHPEARLYQMANSTENQINALNKQKKEFIEKDLPKDRIKRIENQKAVIMKRFNDRLAKFEE